MLQSNHSVNAAGHFCVAGVDTVALAGAYGTPLYVMDEALIRAGMRRIADAMARYLPAGSMPFFASKAMSCKELYRIAADEGIGVDVVSGGELYTALGAGFPAEDICFHGSAKSRAEIRYAIDAGIGRFVVDNAEELRRISAYAVEKGIAQRVLLRVTPGIDPHTFKAVNTGTVESKFGAAIQTGQAMELTRLALAAPGVVTEGFHCHVGSQIMDEKPFCDGADVMVRFMEEVRAAFGFVPAVLDLGGGFGVPYEEGESALDPDTVIRRMAEHLKARCAEAGLPVPVVMTEPGRSIVGAAGVTLYTVEDVKDVPGYVRYVAVDGGMTDNPRYALYEARHTALIADRAGEEKTWRVTVAGRCCESGDLIGEDMPLQPAAVGDTLAVLVTGAYNYSMASNYNRVPRPPVVMLRDGQPRVVVRRETYEDLVACDL